MWQEYLEKVKEAKKGRNWEKGASLLQITSYARKVKKEFGAELPKAYREFLQLTNGMVYNGHNIYGIRGEEEAEMDLIEQTRDFGSEDWTENYLFLGDSDMDLYVYDTEGDTYDVMDPGGEVWESFDTCEELLEYILKSSLGLIEEDDDEEDDE